jgi:urease accessory protein
MKRTVCKSQTREDSATKKPSRDLGKPMNTCERFLNWRRTRPRTISRQGPMLRAIHLPVVFLLIFPTLALGHPGHTEMGGAASGFFHPLTGWDHLLVMLAIGFWASRQGKHAAWAVPLAFLGMLALGAWVGAAVGVPGTWAEAGILLSVACMILLLAAAIRLPLLAAALVAGGFAVFHGYVHGVEMAAGGSNAFVAGLLTASAALHLAGLAAGRLVALSRRRTGVVS